MASKTGFFLILATLAGGAAGAEPTRTAISCTGDTVLDYKSFNLPSKTLPQTRVYVLDEAAKTVSLITEGQPASLCENKSGCQAVFLPAGIQITYAAGEDGEKLVYNRAASTMGDQTENAAQMTTFQGHCQPTELPAAAK